MKKIAIPLFCACAALSAAELECPVYEGGIYGGASWLYLKPTASDGDFQYGTLLTLTDNPPNLTAHMQEFRPDYQSAVRAHLGYRLPCSASAFEVGYFHFNDSKHQNIPEIAENQFFQNFLGGGFSTVDAFERQRLNQVDLMWKTTLIYDDYFVFEPFAGLSYADIQRNMDVAFTDFVLNPQPANLEGQLRSEFWGVGPIIGAQFKHCFLAPLYIKGHLSGGALIGRIKSQTDGVALKEGENISFFARDDYTRVSTMLSGGIGLTYQTSLCNGAIGLEITAGYEVDYYFRAIDRINPSEGFFVDPDSVPVKVSSNLGLAGPYVQLSIFDSPDPSCMKPFMCCPDLCCGFYLEASAAYLKPRATNRDLTFATLHTEDQESRDIRLKPDWAWSGYYDAGYLFGRNTDIRASYMHLYTTDSKNLTAGENQSISSINSSGNAIERYAEANSHVKYKLNQIDLVVGKTICGIHPFAGLRYLDFRRVARNNYLDGVPTEEFESKFPQLVSKYQGVGLVFGVDPDVCIFEGFSIIGHFDYALIIGCQESSLDQNNFGTLGTSSNTLRTDTRDAIVPVVDAKLGLKYQLFAFHVEVGYQFTEYFKAVNLVYPNFLTGLEQINSNFILHGPYATVGVSF